MIKYLAIAVTLFGFQNLGFGHDDGAPTTTLAGHNALHYAGNLIDQQKLDGSFTTNLQTISVVASKEGDTVKGFKATLVQVPGEDGTSSKVDVTLDATTKATQFLYTAGTLAKAAPTWPGDDAITLTENALHYILHNADKPDIDPFNDGFSSITLSQKTLDDGTVTASFDVTAEGQTNVLRIVLNTDSSVRSATVIPAPN